MIPIQTEYKGYKFRSRLEARWAVFFDTLGIQWEYEPEGYVLDNGEYYLPDFRLYDGRAWAEIKGKDFTDEEINKCRLLSVGSGLPVFLFSGIPKAKFYEFTTGKNYLLRSAIPLPLQHEYLQNFKNSGGAFITDDKEWDDQCDMALFYYKHQGINEAVKNAKQARFEHGETPQI